VTKALDELAARQARDEGRARTARQGHVPAELIVSTGRSGSHTGGVERTEAVRDPARRARRPEGSAPGAGRSAAPADPGQCRAGSSQSQGDRLDPAGARGRARPLEAEPVAVQPRDHARARRRPPRRRTRRADRLDRPGARAGLPKPSSSILQIDEDLRTEVGKDLAEIRGKKSEMGEKRVAAEDLLKRIDLIAPRTARSSSVPCTRSAA